MSENGKTRGKAPAADTLFVRSLLDKHGEKLTYGEAKAELSSAGHGKMSSNDFNVRKNAWKRLKGLLKGKTAAKKTGSKVGRPKGRKVARQGRPVGRPATTRVSDFDEAFSLVEKHGGMAKAAAYAASITAAIETVRSVGQRFSKVA